MGTACYKVNKMKNGKRWNKKLLTKFGFNVIFLSSDTADDIRIHNISDYLSHSATATAYVTGHLLVKCWGAVCDRSHTWLVSSCANHPLTGHFTSMWPVTDHPLTGHKLPPNQSFYYRVSQKEVYVRKSG